MCGVHLETSKTRGWLMPLGLIFGFWALLMDGIWWMHMHPDEQLAYFFTRKDLPFLWWYLATQDVHPPLWFTSFYIMREFFGDSEFVARFYSALLSMLTLALVYRLGKRWFGAVRYGVFIMVVLGVNAFFFYHALEVRPYALIMLLATLSMWLYQCWLDRQTWRPALLYGASVASLLYVHYFLFVLVLTQVFYFLVSGRASWRILQQWVGAGGMALVIWLPWLPSAINQIINLRQSDIIGGNERGIIGSGVTTVVTSLETVLALAQSMTNGLLVVYLPILLVGIALLWLRRQYWLALAWAVGAPTLSFALNTVMAVYTPRYVVYVVVGLAVVTGASLAALPIGRWRWLALMALAAVSWQALPAQLPQRSPLRDLLQQVAQEAQPDDVIFFDQRGADSHYMRWMIQLYLGPLRQNRVSSVEEAQAHPRVWFATNDLLNPDIQADFRAIEATHPLQRVIGECSRRWCYVIQLLEAPPELVDNP